MAGVLGLEKFGTSGIKEEPVEKNEKVDVGGRGGDETNGICGPEREWGPGFPLRNGERSSGHLREPVPVTYSLSWKGKLVTSAGPGGFG